MNGRTLAPLRTVIGSLVFLVVGSSAVATAKAQAPSFPGPTYTAPAGAGPTGPAFAQAAEPGAAGYEAPRTGPATGAAAAPVPATNAAFQPPGDSGAAVPGGFPNYSARAGASARPPVYRLASVPHMYGDLFSPSATITALGFNSNTPITADVPLAGGSRRVKIAENNAALPVDRVFFMYNHFQNALEFDANGALPGTEKFPVDRYTVGIEKTFWCGDASLEARVPLNSEFDRALGGGATAFALDGGSLGNVALNAKFVLLRSETGVLATGLGIDLPTGDGVEGTIDTARYSIANDALHLLPWLGVYSEPFENWYYQAFVQLDFATSGNEVALDDGLGGPLVPLGLYNEQNLLHGDLAVGRWLYRCGEECSTMGVAATVELHYTTTLQDTDTVASGGLPSLTINNALNRFDILNLTGGLHATMGLTDLRTGVVVPLREDPDRFFDTEIQVQINRRF